MKLHASNLLRKMKTRVPAVLASLLLFLLCSLQLQVRAEGESSARDLLHQKAEQLKLSESKGWLNLLLYKKSIWGGYVSEVNDPKFFLSNGGQHDPKRELESAIDALLAQAALGERDPNLEARCKFPARETFLTTNLGFVNPNPIECPGFERFKKILSAKSASLVFSSYYLNSPSSAFGHTLLRLNKSELSHSTAAENNELLDFGIGYGANLDSTNVAVYAIAGLAGLSDGSYTNVPYYYKVREYNDFEARDLWSYDLNLTKSEIDMLVEVLWEHGNVPIPYYYLTRNCSYYLFRALEAAAPRLRLLDKLPFWIIPSDTVQVVWATDGFVKDVSYRPAARTLFKERAKRLSANEKLALSKLGSTSDVSVLDNLSEQERVEVLDTAIDEIDANHPREIQDDNSEPAHRKQALLSARAKIRIKTPPLKINPPENGLPHLGHGSTRTGVGYLTDGHKNKTFLSQRFAHHDPLDPAMGYPPHSQIEFMNISAETDNIFHSLRN